MPRRPLARYRRAGFDARKKTAITQMGAGRNAKLMLQFSERIWTGTGDWPGTANGNAWSDTGSQLTWDVTRGQPGRNGILVKYTGGDAAHALTPATPISSATTDARTAAYARDYLDQIEPVYPGVSGLWNQRATLSVPALDPNLGLSYSYWRRGQYTQFGGYEGVRQRNILFAGEHTSQDFQGFMEGGASEGVRAARDILAE